MHYSLMGKMTAFYRQWICYVNLPYKASLTVSTFLFLRKCIIVDLYIFPLTFAHDNIYYKSSNYQISLFLNVTLLWHHWLNLTKYSLSILLFICFARNSFLLNKSVIIYFYFMLFMREISHSNLKLNRF